mmetsp:Transcript_2889/g.9534  ORF Transcript_2889/g.9534 Transcript_2889/m.9534 type:complete len:210 (-) Transcript_2889:349-978(-)
MFADDDDDDDNGANDEASKTLGGGESASIASMGDSFPFPGPRTMYARCSSLDHSPSAMSSGEPGQYATRNEVVSKSAPEILARPNRTFGDSGWALTARRGYPKFSYAFATTSNVRVSRVATIITLESGTFSWRPPFALTKPALAEFTGQPACALTTRAFLRYTYVTNDQYFTNCAGGVRISTTSASLAPSMNKLCAPALRAPPISSTRA